MPQAHRSVRARPRAVSTAARTCDAATAHGTTRIGASTWTAPPSGAGNESRFVTPTTQAAGASSRGAPTTEASETLPSVAMVKRRGSERASGVFRHAA